MENVAEKTSNHLVVAGLIAAATLLSALVFAGWLRFGSDIILTLAANGLSSCL